MPKRNLRNTWLYIADASADVSAGALSGGNSVEVTVGEGNITWNESRAIEYQRDRGRIIDVDTTNNRDDVVGEAIEGDEAPMEVSFNIRFEYYTGASTVNPVEALKGPKSATNYDDVGGTKTRQSHVLDGGALGSWTPADTVDPCSPWAVNIFLKFDPGCGDNTGTAEWLKFPVFRWDQLQFNLNDGQISCSGKCQAVKPTCMKAGDTTWTT